MEGVIQSIISTIPKGKIFDSHFIIDQLIRQHSDEYLRFASDFANSTELTLSVHGKIGQLINGFDGSVLRRLDKESWSENIHGNASACTCWEKLWSYRARLDARSIFIPCLLV